MKTQEKYESSAHFQILIVNGEKLSILRHLVSGLPFYLFSNNEIIIVVEKANYQNRWKMYFITAESQIFVDKVIKKLTGELYTYIRGRKL